VAPDLLCLAKGITGGYLPLAATLTSEEVFSAFLGEYEEFKTFFHGHTYTGNALGCAVAIANLDIFEREKIIERLPLRIAYLAARLEEFRRLAHVSDVRQWGYMVGIELVENKDSRQSYAPENRIGYKVVLEARKRNVMIRPLGDVIVLMPPLSIAEEELTSLVDVVYESIAKVTGH
jgi:adenosylmethionine-8-amino-7-oxononanoate aminotransferase